MKHRGKKKKESKEMRTISGTSRTMWNHRSPRRRRPKKGHEKLLEEIIAENFPKMEKEIATQVQETQRNTKVKRRNPREKRKVKHPKTHINQIKKDQTQRTNIKSSKGETTNNTQRYSHKDNS